MFDVLVSGMQAYNQVGLFFGAVICLGIGGLLSGGAFYWRLHALRATGTVIGVIPSGNTYASVYRYTMQDGQTHVAKSNDSSNIVSGKRTGRVVPLLISPHNPSDARQANDWSLEIIGLVFLAPGVWLGWTALTAYPFTPMTAVMAGAFAIYFGERALRVFRKNGPHVSIGEWIRLIRQGTAPTDVDLSQVKPIESLVPADKLNTSWREQLAAQKRVVWVPLLMAIIFPLIAVSQGVNIFRLETAGVRTTGTVIDIVGSDDTDGHWTYRALVRFRIADASVQFYDSVGGNPAPLQMGDRVAVLYFADAPSSAIVDRGVVENAFIPALLLAGGLFAGWIAWVMLTTRSHTNPEGAVTAQLFAK